LIEALRSAAERLGGGKAAAPVLRETTATLAAKGFEVNYFALVDGPTLSPIELTSPGARLIAAAKLGNVRLLDNIGVG
jgi:pantoate--beta-alanine ligase